MPAPGDDVTAMKIRGVAYRLWRRVPAKEKEEWKDLYYVRHSDPNVYKKALRLLRKQGHLAKLKADCRHIVNNADAGSAQSTSARPEATTKAPVFLEDTASSQRTSDRAYSPPDFILSAHTPSDHTSAALSVCKDNAGARSTSDHSSPSDTTRSQHISAAYPSRPKRDASIENIQDQSFSQKEVEGPILREPTLVAGSRLEDDDSVQSTPGQSSSPPAPTASENTPVIHPTRMNNLKTKSNFPTLFSLLFYANQSEQVKLPALFPLLSRARSNTSSNQPCYVPFTPRREDLPSCLFVINTPDARTKRRLKMADMELIRSTSGIAVLRRLHKNALIASFPTEAEARIAQKSLRITMPSSVGDPVDVEASFHGKFPSRVFSCKKDLPIRHGTVASRIMTVLGGPVAGVPRASFEVLRQGTEGPPTRETRYLVRFDFAVHPPCNSWMQSFYIPMDHDSIDVQPRRAWAVFTPEDVYVRCALCGKHCQRGRVNTCPFTEVIGGQRDD
jgi:hypothetical protein